MHFTSDNASGVPDEVLAAIAAANSGYAPSYGADPIMDRVRDRIREIFEAPEAAVYLVATGTAANALSLALFCPPWASVYCHRASHVEQDECGAPEFYTGGAKLVLLDGDHARIDTTTLSAALGAPGPRFVHSVQKGMLSLTNATEAGTTYTPAQVAELSAIARAHDMSSHMDGARFANALVALGCTPAELTWKAGIDVLSFGGTKNGLHGRRGRGHLRP
jgi:threonine aldolase